MPDEFQTKPVGKRIYADTVAEYDTSKYRIGLCEKWLKEGSRSVEHLPYTPTSMLTTESHARKKLEERRGRPFSEPNHESFGKLKHSSRPLQQCKRPKQSPPEYIRDVIDAPDEFKFKCPQPVRKTKREATPYKPVEEFDDFLNDYMEHPQQPSASAADVKNYRDRKRKHELMPEFVLEDTELSDFFGDDAKKMKSAGRQAKKVQMFDDLAPDHREQAPFEVTKKRPEATRTSDAMALYKPHDRFDTDFGHDFMNVAHTSRDSHLTAENIRKMQHQQIERRTEKTKIIVMPSRSNRGTPIILDIDSATASINIKLVNDYEDFL